MVEPPPSEGGEATITAMSALAAVGQYMSTNSAKSTEDIKEAAKPNKIALVYIQNLFW